MANARHDRSSSMPEPTGPTSPNAETETPLPALAQYGITLLLVAAAALLAFIASQFVPAPGLTLIFVLPVVIAGTAFGWGPSVAAIAASILTFDFFFTQPYLTLQMTEPSEIWAAGLLLITAAIVSGVTWQSRQRAFEARRAAAQAEALQSLAHAIIQGAPQAEIIQAAARALSRIFVAPAAILSQIDGRLRVEVIVGAAELSEAETEAAARAMAARSHMRGQTYPNDRSRFDFWPVATATGCRFVLGVDFGRSPYDRPADPDRFIEIVGAYIAINLASTGR
jgi:K+-sensing histidine kinase KdpD